MSNKRNLTLDLQSGPAKRTRITNANTPILTTPDVQKLNMPSPELAKFLNATSSLPTPTPSGYAVAYPKSVAEEQELYTNGFQEAMNTAQEKEIGFRNETTLTTLEKPHHISRSFALSSGSSTTIVSTASAPSNHVSDFISRPSSEASGSIDSSDVHIKEEEQDFDSDDEYYPNSSSGSKMSPIDMKDQERIKLERKRQRNRVAASKCRKRKLERISQLEDKVQKLKSENGDLAGVVKKLKDSICNLKQELMSHAQSGCQVMMASDA